MMKSVQLTEAEWKAIDMFLEELGNYQSSAGCNDLPEEIKHLFTEEEGKKLAAELHEGPSWPLPDFCLLTLLQRKINDQIT
jgi:hypothetical protein